MGGDNGQENMFTQLLAPQSPPRSRFKLFLRSSPTVQSDNGEPITNELTRYLAIPVESSPNNPLAWWNAHHEDFPVLSKLAYDYLSCPAMSAEYERIFSRINLLITDDRRSLLTTSVESEVLLHK